ncbi:hypothetical protein GOODEAATRI_030235 [Goodea atripinnis]|uniref:Uncharacterized protein n=1 Tax=Goodea atripinnis TaxID=208336 RepID=A0ABV0P900_9TELE
MSINIYSNHIWLHPNLHSIYLLHFNKYSKYFQGKSDPNPVLLLITDQNILKRNKSLLTVARVTKSVDTSALECWSIWREPIHAQVQQAKFIQKGLGRDLNPGPSSCQAVVLTTAQRCSF